MITQDTSNINVKMVTQDIPNVKIKKKKMDITISTHDCDESIIREKGSFGETEAVLFLLYGIAYRESRVLRKSMRAGLTLCRGNDRIVFT